MHNPLSPNHSCNKPQDVCMAYHRQHNGWNIAKGYALKTPSSHLVVGVNIVNPWKSVVFEGFPKIFAIILFNPKSGMPTTKPRKGPFPAAPKDEPSSTGFSVGTDCSETWRTGEVLKCWRTVVKKDVTHQFRNSIVLGFLKWRYPQIIRFSRMFTDFPLLW